MFAPRAVSIAAWAPACRALRDWPAIELIDDVAANQFRVVTPRPRAGTVAGEGTGVAAGVVTREVLRICSGATSQ
jgi:hypothetical protein